MLFTSSYEKKQVTLAEYVSRAKEDQKNIYYACGDTIERIEMLPQCDAVKEKGYEILYLTDNIDEFALKMMREYDSKSFVNVCDESLDLDSEEEKKELEKLNADSKELLDAVKEALGEKVNAVKFTNKLKNNPVCLASEGGISLEMEKTLNAMPGQNTPVKAQTVLEINASHPVAEKLKSLITDEEKLKKYALVLYAEARIIEGLPLENATETTDLIAELISE